MGRARGQVKFNDTIKFFIYDSTEDICRPKLYDTFNELLDNWEKSNVPIVKNITTYDKRSWVKNIFKSNRDENKNRNGCNHQEENVVIYQDYGGGFHWKGTACRKCNMILKGIEPLKLPVVDRYDGVPNWAENFDDYYYD